LFFVCAKILSSWLNTSMAAENAGRSFDEGLGDLLHVRTVLGGGVTEFVGTLQQHQNDVLHCYTGLLRVGGGDADIKAEPFDLRRGAAPLDQGPGRAERSAVTSSESGEPLVLVRIDQRLLRS